MLNVYPTKISALISGVDMTTAMSFVEFLKLDCDQAEQLMSESLDKLTVIKNANLHARRLSTQVKNSYCKYTIFYNSNFYCDSPNKYYFLDMFIRTIKNKLNIPFGGHPYGYSEMLQLPPIVYRGQFTQTLEDIKNGFLTQHQRNFLNVICGYSVDFLVNLANQSLRIDYPSYWINQRKLNHSVSYGFPPISKKVHKALQVIVLLNPPKIEWADVYVACSRKSSHELKFICN